MRPHALHRLTLLSFLLAVAFAQNVPKARPVPDGEKPAAVEVSGDVDDEISMEDYGEANEPVIAVFLGFRGTNSKRLAPLWSKISSISVNFEEKV